MGAQMNSLLKQHNYFLFEIFLAFRIIAAMSPHLAMNLLTQDKLCLVTFNQSVNFCQNIQKEMNSTEDKLARDKILAETAQFGNYKHFIDVIPMVVWSLFLGSFLDKFPTGTYVIMVINSFGSIVAALIFLAQTYYFNLSPYYLLLASFTVWFTGGMMSFAATLYRYITINSDEKSRGLKFVFLEITVVIGFSFATILGGQLLRLTEIGPQLRTYHLNFISALVLEVLCLFLLYLLYQSEKSSKSEKKPEKIKQIAEKGEKTLPVEFIGMKKIDPNNNDLPVKAVAASSREKLSDQNFFKVLFNMENVRETFQCFFKYRDNNVRTQIFLLCLIIFNAILVTQGLGHLMVQFAQKVYNWNPPTFANYAALQHISHMTMMALLSFIFINWLQMPDSILILLAHISIFLADFVRGTFLSPTAFFVSIPIGCLSGFGLLGTKTKLSKIIPKEESGKIFSLSATIESLVPLVASLIYSSIFSLSISTYPGMIYHFSCVLMVVSMGILWVEHVYCPVKSLEEQEAKESSPKLET